GGDLLEGAELGDHAPDGLGFGEALLHEAVLLVLHHRAQLGPRLAQARGVGIGGEEGVEVGVDDVHGASFPSAKWSTRARVRRHSSRLTSSWARPSEVSV